MKEVNLALLFFPVCLSILLSCNEVAKRTGTQEAVQVTPGLPEQAMADTAIHYMAPGSSNKGLLVLQSRACYFEDADSLRKKTDIHIENPTPREMEQINSILQYTGLPQNFTIYRGDVNNALATVVDNQRVIVYNKDFFARMDAIASTYWASMFIIAHEIGHHLAANISDTSNVLDAELQADYFAGAVLHGMGADSNEVVAVFASNFLSNERESATHPAKKKRIAAVKNSWNEASRLRLHSAIPPPIKDAFSEAAGKPILTDGFGSTSAGFDEAALLENQWVMDHNRSSLKYRNVTRASMYHGQVAAAVSRNYQGIILDVQQQKPEKGCEEMLFLVIEVLITKTDAVYNRAGLRRFTKNRFLVCLDTGNGFVMGNDPMGYFAGGRRFEFDITDINNHPKTQGLQLISRAVAL